MKTLNDCKEEVAKSRQFSSFEKLTYFAGINYNVVKVFDEVAELYKNQSIKRDPKVERPPLNQDILFCFKYVYPGGKETFDYQVGQLLEDSDTIYYGDNDTLYKFVEWWCFIEEIF